MPSTVCSSVTMVFDSSTVMTPSLPTFFIASAMVLPMVSSPLAEMVPTCAIMSPETGFENFFTSSTTISTARSMPRFSAIGFAPAATAFTPSRKMHCARTVAVVVPSPATSEVLEATSRTICAPIFSSGSLSSTSLATVTPSLVMVGPPNFFSSTTLRPLGPSVTFTASANWFTPRRIAWREFSLYTICFAAMFDSPFENWLSLRLFRSAFEHAQYFVLAHDHILCAVDLNVGTGVFAEQNAITGLNVERNDLTLVVALAVAYSNDFAFLRLFLGGIGNVKTANLVYIGIDPFDHDPVVKRSNVHSTTSILEFVL